MKMFRGCVWARIKETWTPPGIEVGTRYDDFVITPAQARELGEWLIAAADELEER